MISILVCALPDACVAPLPYSVQVFVLDVDTGGRWVWLAVLGLVASQLCDLELSIKAGRAVDDIL